MNNPEKRPRDYANDILKVIGKELEKVPIEYRELVINHLASMMMKRANRK